MKWTCCISRIDRIWETYPTLLPRCAFILTDGTTVKKLSGWLPCHHANISYTLEINDNNIQRILDIAKKDKRKDEQVIRSTNTRFKKDKKEHFNQYITLANKAYTSKSLWILSIIYPLWKLKTLDIEDTYNNLLANIMQICDRESRLSLSKLWYDKIL